MRGLEVPTPSITDGQSRSFAMKSMLAQRSVGSLVTECQKRAFVFEKFGIDYCCHGAAPLKEACAGAEVALNDVLDALDSIAIPASGKADVEYSKMPLVELIDDIVTRHHRYLSERLPVLAGMIDRLVAAHGKRHIILCAVREVFAGLRDELTSHMMKEERVLFPIIVDLERASLDGHAAPQFHCGSVTNPISVMESEHDSAGEALGLLRRLTDDYQPPKDACPTYCATLAGLRELEMDLHLHIHKENNILFPRAVELESRVASADVGRIAHAETHFV